MYESYIYIGHWLGAPCNMVGSVVGCTDTGKVWWNQTTLYGGIHVLGTILLTTTKCTVVVHIYSEYITSGYDDEASDLFSQVVYFIWPLYQCFLLCLYSRAQQRIIKGYHLLQPFAQSASIESWFPCRLRRPTRSWTWDHFRESHGICFRRR